MTTKLGMIVTYLDELVRLWDHVTNYNHYISTTTAPIAIRLGRAVTNLDGLLPIMLLNSLVPWSCDITKNNKLKTLYLHYDNAYSHQNWQWCELPWAGIVRKFTWLFDHVLFWDNVMNYNYYVSNNTIPMATKLGGVVTYLERLLPIKSHGYIFKCSCEITWQTKIIIHPLSQCLCLPNLAGWGYTMTSSFHKLTKAQPGKMVACSFSPKDHFLQKTIISPVPQSSWPLNLAIWWVTMRCFHA